MEKQKSTGKTVAIVILIILLLGAVGYIAYDKILVKETKESTQTETQVEDNTVEESVDTTEYYQSHGEALTKDMWEDASLMEEIGEKCDGIRGGQLNEIILKSDGTYEYHYYLTCGDAGNQMGTYTLENNKLTLICIPDKSDQCVENKVFEKNENGTLTNNEGLVLNKVTKEEIFYFVNEE